MARLLLFFFLINFSLCWVFVAARRLSLVAASGGYSLLRCVGFSLRWLLLLRSTGSRHAGFSSCGSRALERRLSSCGAGLSCSVTCAIFPDQGSNPCPLHWQADSFFFFLNKFFLNFYLFVYLFMACVGSSFLCEGSL